MDGQDLYGTGFAVVVIGAPALAQAAGDLVRQAGGRVLRNVAWPAVAEEIGQQAGRPLLLVDTHGADAATIEIALARIDAVATALDLPIVVSMATGDIDLVAAMLLGPRVAMLCDASPLELVAALAVAGAAMAGRRCFILTFARGVRTVAQAERRGGAYRRGAGEAVGAGG